MIVAASCRTVSAQSESRDDRPGRRIQNVCANMWRLKRLGRFTGLLRLMETRLIQGGSNLS